MNHLLEKIKQNKPALSFEIFPPKQNTDIATLVQTINDLAAIEPDFISVTYSAGGSGNSESTVSLVGEIADRGISAVAHLTCITSTKEDIAQNVEKLKQKGVYNILALRGDMPKDPSVKVEKDYRYAKDLIADLKADNNDLCISAAAYPEGHIECSDEDLNVEHMKQKVDAGADFFITQLFFENSRFYRFMEKVQANHIKQPLIAGIMPFMSKSQVQRMIFTCGTSLPTEIIKLLYRYENDTKGLQQAGIEYAITQCEDLLKNGVDGIHLYTMNRSFVAQDIVSAIKG